MVADEASLLEGAGRLQPDVAVVDLSLARDGGLDWLRALRQRCPDLKVIVLSVHDEESRAPGGDGGRRRRLRAQARDRDRPAARRRARPRRSKPRRFDRRESANRFDREDLDLHNPGISPWCCRSNVSVQRSAVSFQLQIAPDSVWRGFGGSSFPELTAEKLTADRLRSNITGKAIIDGRTRGLSHTGTAARSGVPSPEWRRARHEAVFGLARVGRPVLVALALAAAACGPATEPPNASGGRR